MKSRFATCCLVALFSFAGGFAAQLLGPRDAIAAAVAERMQRFSDVSGTTRIDIGMYNGIPMQNFYGEDGKLRIQLATYVAPGEQGLPMIGLSDNKGDLRMLLRLAGSNESPVLIFKDKQHRDRMVMGLGLSDAGQEPFLAYFDDSGERHMAFGKY